MYVYMYMCGIIFLLYSGNCSTASYMHVEFHYRSVNATPVGTVTFGPSFMHLLILCM